MNSPLKIGYFKHWLQPPYPFVEFLRESGIQLEQIDVSVPRYLEKFQVALIEQNGFNDYIENDEPYIHDWVRRGGILCFMHQDYQRWVPQFLPEEAGYTQLIHRYIPTILGDPENAFTNDTTPYMTYLMPWIEAPGKRLFREPEKITPDDMIHWNVPTGTFSILRDGSGESRQARTAAESCYLANEKWEILGSFKDPGVRDGALILRAKCGKGMIFLNQFLFPEKRVPEDDRCLRFWKKYVPNLLAYFRRFLNGESEELPPGPAPRLPEKRNYKLAIHMHSLDWYGCDAQPGTINALMREMGFDICALALKDTRPYNGGLSAAQFSDDRVLFLDGQEYHPFNWKDSYDHVTHNNYHILAIGTDPDAYTPEFTRSLYGDAEVEAYLKRAIDYIHRHGGAACATHPWFGYWRNYPYDAADTEPMRPLSGSDLEKHWIAGGRIAVMNSVDLFGTRRMYDYPAVNFLYLKGEEPCRDSVVRAIRAGHVIAAAGFDEADVSLNGRIPGDVMPLEEARDGVLHVSAKIRPGGKIREIRVYSGPDVIWRRDGGGGTETAQEIPLRDLPLKNYLRVEIEGERDIWICASTPIYFS